MKQILDRETGKVTNVEAVDAREILNSNPERYTTDPDAIAKAAEKKPIDITKPDGAPRLSDSGFPAGTEFKRRVTEDDQRLLQAEQHEGRSLPPDGGRVDATAQIRAAREAERKEASGDADTSSMTAAEMKAELDRRGVRYPSTANKAELRALLDA